VAATPYHTRLCLIAGARAISGPDIVGADKRKVSEVSETDVQRWEYLQVLVDASDWIDSGARAGHLNSLEGGGLRLIDSAAVLNDRGAAGWELVGVVPGSSVYGYQLFLKRPVGA
jgi:hypothetical protein